MAKFFRQLLMAAAKGRGKRIFVLNDPRPSIVISAELSMEAFRTLRAEANVYMTANAEFCVCAPMDVQMASMSAASGTGEIFLQKVMNLGGVDIYFAASAEGTASNSVSLEMAVAALIRSDSELNAPTVVSLNLSADPRLEELGEANAIPAHGYFAEQATRITTDATGKIASSVPARLSADIKTATDATGASVPTKMAGMAAATRVDIEAEVRRATIARVTAMAFPKLRADASPDLGGFGAIPVQAFVSMHTSAEMDAFQVPVQDGKILIIRQVQSAIPDGNALKLI